MSRLFRILVLLLATGAIFYACQKNAPSYTDQESAPVSAAEDAGTDVPGAQGKAKDGTVSADAFITAVTVVGKFDSLKKFVRTADLKFRVQDAVKTTLQIEDIALQNGGFVTVNNLKTEVESRYNTPVSGDSMLEITSFRVQNEVTLRVPYAKLDTTLRAIGRLVDFLDYRNVHAKDVGLDLLEQELTRVREQLYQEDAASALQRPGAKPESLTHAADKIRDSRANTDAARIERLKLEDAIQYSTVRLDIYQRSQTQHRLLPREKPVTAFQPGLFVQLGEALKDGWSLVKMIILGLARLWGIVLIAVLLYFGIRWARKRFALPATGKPAFPPAQK
ncbi:MAG TPA: DUF4349 domain-containing protein [Saprospiraceae bacterium]|nr:DUF4349 domain-containing protein [Saprospiraceae bacterium]